MPAKKKTAKKKATTRKPKSGLSAQHEKFAQLIAEGKPKGRAYMAVYKDVKDLHGACTNAIRLLKNAEVAERVQTLRAEIEDESCLSRMQIRKIRAEIATEQMHAPSDRLKACKDDADMMGYNEPEEIKIEHSGSMTITPFQFTRSEAKKRLEQIAAEDGESDSDS